MPGSDNDAPRSSSAVDVAIEKIRCLIRQRALKLGDVLPSEVELAEMFGLSRNTVREAVRTLKAYGVVESRQKVGSVLVDGRRAAITALLTTALEISADTFLDIQGFRRLTEMNLADMLIDKMPGADLDAMAAINATMASTDDPVQASELDFRFHLIMVEAAGNSTLTEVYCFLKPVIRRLMEAGKSNRAALHDAAGEHAAIIDALRHGNRIAFTFHMDRHLDAGLRFIPGSRIDEPSATSRPR